MKQAQVFDGWCRYGLWLITLAPIVWLVMVMAWGAFYSFPQTDDFCAFGRLFVHEGYNPFRDVGSMYQAWTGRYSSVFVVALAGWLVSVVPWSIFVTYHIALIALILVFIVGCVLTTTVISSSRYLNIAVAGIACVAALTLMPSRLEGVYWLTGAAVYITGIGAFLMLVRSMVRDDSCDHKQLPAKYPWMTLFLIVLCVGFNELLALSLGELLLLRMVFYARGRAWRRQNFAYGLVYLAALLVSVCAPGNFLRDKASSVPRHEVGETVRLALGSFRQFIDGLIIPNSVTLLAMLIGLALLSWAMKPERWIAGERLAPIVLTLLSAIPLHLFVYSFLVGEASPGRIINQCYAMTLIGGCILMAWLGVAAVAKIGGRARARMAGAVLVVIGLVFLSSTPYRQVASTIRDFGPTWRSQQLQRLGVLEAGRGRSVLLPSFTTEGATPPLFQGGDITEDSNYWVNSCMSSAYGTKDVRLSKTN